MLPGLGGKDRLALGIPTERQYISAYCENRGISEIQHWNFYMAFSFYRFAAILQGVKKRSLDGNASNPRALKLAELIGPLAEMAIYEI